MFDKKRCIETIYALAKAKGLKIGDIEEKAGGTQEQIDLAIAMTRVALYVAIVISAILLVFEVLCGLKCSMHGKWRIGAIVFGILLCVDYVWAITRGGWMNWVSALIAGFYLVGAIMCKPDAPKAE